MPEKLTYEELKQRVKDLEKMAIDHKRTVAALRESEARYRQILNIAPAGIYEVDFRTGKFISVNDAVCEYSGYTRDELLSMNSLDVLTKDSQEKLLERMAKVLNGKETPGSVDYEIIKKDGSTGWLRINNRYIYEGDNIVGSTVVASDITDRRQVEIALQAAHEELEQRVRERTAQIDAKNKELKDFAYIVSHDLKAPLRAISQLTDWIATDYTDRLDPAGKNMMSMILKRVQRMDGLIEGILSYSRIGGGEEKIESLDLNQFVREEVDNLVVPDNFKVIIADDLPVVRQDPIPMGHIFQNLIGNAIKFMDKPEGFVRLSCERRGDHWEFTVSDNGPGIDPKYHKKIFQIFQTLAPRDDLESTGIGLTQVKKAVETSGGSIRVESIVGQGSTFIFTLPAGGKRDEKQPTNPPV